MIAVLTSVLLQGCIVKSLHPFFFENDVVFKTELLNEWVDQDSGKWVITRVKEKSNAYSMKFTKDDKEAIFMVHLFALEGEFYLDFLPLSSSASTVDIFELHLLPTHSVAKLVMVGQDEVQIKWFNEEWLRSLFEQNRIKIAHETISDELPKDNDDVMYVLTAATDELQKFLIKYGNEGAAFDNNDTMWLRLKKGS